MLQTWNHIVCDLWSWAVFIPHHACKIHPRGWCAGRLFLIIAEQCSAMWVYHSLVVHLLHIHFLRRSAHICAGCGQRFREQGSEVLCEHSQGPTSCGTFSTRPFLSMVLFLVPLLSRATCMHLSSISSVEARGWEVLSRGPVPRGRAQPGQDVPSRSSVF